MEFIRNGDTTGMLESWNLWREPILQDSWKMLEAPKKWPVPSRKIVFQSHGPWRSVPYVPSFQARASFSGQCLALSHLDSSFAEPGRHYQMVWFPLFWRGAIRFKNYRNELPDKHGSSMSCWARINIARIKIGGCCCNRTCAPQSSKRCKQSSCPRSAACWKRSNSWWPRDYGQHFQLKTLTNLTDYKYSHPQIDGKVNHHQISRDLLFHLFGDDYSQ